MSDPNPTVEMLSTFADPNRIRLLRLLDETEISVGELVEITGLSQSRVSTHLSRLRKVGLVRQRRVGPSSLYRTDGATLSTLAAPIWSAVRAAPESTKEREDRARRRAVLAARAATSPWPDEVAGQMEGHYSPGRTWEATARGLVELLELGHVLDVGSGDGVIAQLLANRARRVTCLDRSEKVIEAARNRLAHLRNVELDVGDMHALPYSPDTFDRVLLLHVLTYADDPRTVISEAARVLRPGGQLVAATLAPHDHTDLATSYGHVNTGLSPERLASMTRTAGLEVRTCGLSSRERKPPYFSVVTLHAQRPGPHKTP